ncbi:hypothetical protein PAPYR_11946 [Paratrimastix pyriformis]|uniref:Uncharacterized protein n=1 Tax=Paratrimastix pyriformis TaxID=342808 RepID=A0ABQ8U2Q8_9EUKA|nr:hypothetical protein PAPYR_11946 [Paratrimastix pyriformis]
MTLQILFDQFLDVSAVLRACCASVHSFLVWVCLGLSHEGCPSFSELVKENAWRPPLTKLTDDERRDLIARGICTRCRQPGHDRFHCPLNSATPSPWPRGPLTPATPLLPQPAPQPSSTAGPTPSPSPARAPFVFQSARPPPPPRRSDRQHQPPTRFSPSTSSVQTQDDLPHSVAPTQGGPVVQQATPAAEVSALAATLTAASDLCPAVPAPPGVKGTVHLAADGRAYVEDRGLTFLLDSGSNVTLTSEHYALAKGLALTEEPQPRTVALANRPAHPCPLRWAWMRNLQHPMTLPLT